METKTVNVGLATAWQIEGSKYIEVRKGMQTKRGEFILTWRKIYGSVLTTIELSTAAVLATTPFPLERSRVLCGLA